MLSYPLAFSRSASFCFNVGLNMLFSFSRNRFHIVPLTSKNYFPITNFHRFLVDAFFLILLVSMQFAQCLPMFVFSCKEIKLLSAQSVIHGSNY